MDSFYNPAKMGGEVAVETIRQIYTNSAGLTPVEYHQKYQEILDSLPLNLNWKLEDSVGSFYCDCVADD